jgi:beta-lactam-binding protein with PASTA domain
MSACASCGYANPDGLDFCPKCGAYTRWDPTVHVGAVRGPAPEQEQAPGRQPEPEEPKPALTGVPAKVADSVIVTVRRPDDESADAPVALTLAPGNQATLLVNVRNQSGIVDNYDLEVRGLPAEWWTLSPPTVYLVPYGAPGGSYEGESTLRLHPPRTPEAEARPWPIEIVACSRARGEDAGKADATVTLEPYAEIESELRPQIATGRRGAEFAIAVRNVANAPLEVVVGALDSEDACGFDFDKQQLSTAPGRRDGTPFRVKPPAQMIFGRTKERKFNVTAQVVGSDVAARPQAGTFKQRPWIPAWTLPIIPILIAAGIAIYALRPNDTKVPELAGSKLFAAQQKLSDAGLKLGQQQPEETAKAPPGTILASIPAAGKSIGKGKEVTVLIAVGSTKVTVPTVVGLTFQAADNRLRKKGLQVGLYEPKFDDPATAIVAHQTPDPGSLTAKGSGVDLAIDPATATAASTTATTAATDTTATDTTATAATTGGGAGSTASTPTTPTVMPAVAGLAAGAAINLLSSGVKTSQQLVYSDTVKAGAVVGAEPAEGTKLKPGQKVTLLISQGPAPPIAFSRDGKIFVMTDEGKLRGAPIATSGASDEEPAWNAKGDLLAYVQRNPADNTSSIWVVNPAKPQTARQLTGDGFVDKRPSISPNGRVIAFVRASAKTPTDFRLCFKRVSSSGRIPVCVRTPAASVARPAWAPDGHAISVILQSDPKDANQTEVALFTSATANSAVPANWNYRGPITDDMHSHKAHEGALYASWSPDGKTLAVSANWGTPFFHLELVTINNDLPKPGAKPVAVPRVHSCDVSWRPDGLVLVVQQSDTCDGSVSSIMRVVLATRDLKPLQSGLTPAWAPAVAKP